MAAKQMRREVRVALSLRAQPAWFRLGWEKRVEILKRAGDLISERAMEYAALMSIEVGKNRLEAMGDVDVELYDEQLQIIDSSIRSGVQARRSGAGDDCRRAASGRSASNRQPWSRAARCSRRSIGGVASPHHSAVPQLPLRRACSSAQAASLLSSARSSGPSESSGISGISSDGTAVLPGPRMAARCRSATLWAAMETTNASNGRPRSR